MLLRLAQLLHFHRSRPRGRGRRARSLGGLRLAAACVLVFALTLGAGLVWERMGPAVPPASSPPPARDAGATAPVVAKSEVTSPRARLAPAGDGLALPGAEVVRVIDGDTFAVAGGEHVRVLNIDTPEMPPRSRCPAEAQLALAAQARLDELIGGRRVALLQEGRDRDGYGRMLRRVEVDGRDVGEALVAEGLARAWRGRREPWC